MHSSEFIFNANETWWLLCETPHGVPAEKGPETVKIKSTPSETLSFTALGFISAEGDKLPLWLILMDKTD
jgi:hypothetical protein